jgi:hypothetical protein
MELIDRYLEAVRKDLPWKRQDDIIAELRANLESQLEDKEAGLGRPMTEGEAEAWLRQVGPPKAMAAQYRPQRYLIGPGLYPAYRLVMLVVFFWVTIVSAIGTAARIAAGSPGWKTVMESSLRLPVTLFVNAAVVTLVFAAIEFFANRASANRTESAAPAAEWSPGALPPAGGQAARGKKPHTRAHALAEVIFGFLFLAWLMLVPKHPYLLLGPGALYPSLWHTHISPFQLAPVWVPVYWCVVALTLLKLGWQCVDLWRGSWQGPRLAQRIAMSVLGLVPLGVMLSDRDRVWITLKDPAKDGARFGGALDALNHAIYTALVVVCTIAVLQLVWKTGKMGVDAYRNRLAAMR